jgi:hypothetical protein
VAKPRKLVLGPPASRDKDDSEVRWLMSYSDFMMQLVCLFILLYSVSSLDKGRMNRVASGYRASIGIGDLAAHETKSVGDRLAIGDRSPLGGELGGGDLPRDLRYRIEPAPLTQNVPPLIVVEPVCVLIPEASITPSPDLVNVLVAPTILPLNARSTAASPSSPASAP